MMSLTITVQVPDDLDREEIEEIQQAAQDWVIAHWELEGDCE